MVGGTLFGGGDDAWACAELKQLAGTHNTDILQGTEIQDHMLILFCINLKQNKKVELSLRVAPSPIGKLK